MNLRLLLTSMFIAGVGALMVGCQSDDVVSKKEPAPKSASSPSSSAPPKKVPVGNNVFLEVQGDQRRVLIQAKVCLRQGQLEQFLTRTGAKEHESVLAAEVDARKIHAALQLAQAEPGNPVRFRPQYTPARGTVIKVFLEYETDGNKQRVPAQKWIRSFKTKKDLDQDWVFAGSVLIPDPLDKTREPFYGANEGDLICVSNFETALLDLPIESSQLGNDLTYEAHTERIPPLDTPVTVVLEPVVRAAKK